MSRRFFATIATASALSLGASLLTPVATIAEEADVCQQPGLEIQSGTCQMSILLEGEMLVRRFEHPSDAVASPDRPEVSRPQRHIASTSH